MKWLKLFENSNVIKRFIFVFSIFNFELFEFIKSYIKSTKSLLQVIWKSVDLRWEIKVINFGIDLFLLYQTKQQLLHNHWRHDLWSLQERQFWLHFEYQEERESHCLRIFAILQLHRLVVERHRELLNSKWSCIGKRFREKDEFACLADRYISGNSLQAWACIRKQIFFSFDQHWLLPLLA